MLEGLTSALDAVAVTTSAPVVTTPSRTLLEPAITFILSLPESSLKNLQSHSSSIEALLQPMIAATAGSGETLPSKIDQFKLALFDTLTSDPKSYVLVTNETRWQSTTSSTTSAVTSTTQTPMMPSTKITAFSVASDKTSQTSTPSPLWTASQTTPRQQQQSADTFDDTYASNNNVFNNRHLVLSDVAMEYDWERE
ncbi:hypothetical protein C0Q70_03475 [Pomacea canaliculata]|uniref:Uncharacterized protein n=1 Tax=Pomacea canaliculata TaxID=400727 RepID=A0A2T7PSU1_POMCA|nr:hypothetical protein C0Q70_03475 [Pomacea canaliculata]